MDIIDKINRIKKDTAERIVKIEDSIRYAYQIYSTYKDSDSVTYQDYLKLDNAINSFYYDDKVFVQTGNLDYDYLPVSMYLSMKNHKYIYCRTKIRKLDKKLKKEGIIVDEMVSFIESERNKYNMAIEK